MKKGFVTNTVSRAAPARGGKAIQRFYLTLRSATLLAASLIVSIAPVKATASGLFYYDVADATSSSLPLAPVYQDNSGESLSASSLTGSGLSPTWACCQSSVGELSFTGWGGGRPGGAFNPGTNGAYLQFSITANDGPIELSELDYSWFSDLNSDLYNGPDRLSIYVSFDGFSSDSLVGTRYTPPGYPYFGSVNNYSDNLSAFTIEQGQTMSVRFVAWSDAAFWDSGAGPWAVGAGEENITLSGTAQATPEPASWTLFLAGIALVAVGARRSKKSVGVVAIVLAALWGISARAQTGCVQVPTGAVAWWSFGEASGSVAADRAGGHTGAYTNNPVQAAGEVRGALRFNGTNYVTVPNSAAWQIGASDFTIELWANFDSAPGGSIGEPAAILVANDEGPNNRNKWFFAVGGGDLYFHINSPSIGPHFFPLVPFTPVVGQWYHLAIVRIGSQYTVFINGIASGSASNTNVFPTPNAPLTIGEGENIGFTKGRLDEVTIYSQALAPEEIAAIYDSASSGKCINVQVSPLAGGDTGNVSVHLNGVGFQQGASINLAMAGQASISGNPVTVGANGTTIDTTFNLAGQTDGAWDVVVTNPGGATITLPQGFTIQRGSSAQIWADVVGLGLIAPNRPQTFQIFYGNTGNEDAIGVPLWIGGIPPDATVNWGFNVLPPLPLDNPADDFSNVPTSVNLGNEIVGAFLLPAVPAGSTSARQFTVSVPEIEDFQLHAWTTPPWFGAQASSSSASTLQAAQVQSNSSAASGGSLSIGDILGCTLGILDNLYFEQNPNTACVQSEFQAYEAVMTDAAEVKTEGRIGFSDVFNTFWSIVHGAYQCAYATACDVCATPVAAEVIPEACVVCEANRFLQDFNNAYSAYGTLMACAGVEGHAVDALLPVQAIGSFDPNGMVGTRGVGGPQWISAEQPLRYSISFENLASATAPAQQVVITDQLDPTKVDLSTLSLGPIAFGSQQVIPVADSSTLSTTVDLRPAQSLIVDVTASLNPLTGVLTWRFASIDPSTGNPPVSPAVGFLPPDVNPPQGDGSVLFTVMPKSGTATGTQIGNQATIIFDANAPIATPGWTNTTDATPPVSAVVPLPTVESTSCFRPQWTATDVGSGVAGTTILVSDNGGPYTEWLNRTTQASAIYNGVPGHSYSFYSQATDLTGNIEASRNKPDASTLVAASSSCNGKPSIAGSIAAKSLLGSTETLTLQLTNNGTGDAPNVNITSIALRTLVGTGSVTLSTPVPVNAGSLAAGASVTETLTLAIPPGIREYSVTEKGTVQDLAGNTYSFSAAQAVLP